MAKVQLIATDSGNPPRNSTASLVVKVSDVNDNAPTFVSETPTNFSIPEVGGQSVHLWWHLADINWMWKFEVCNYTQSSKAGRFVGAVLATDGDIGRNGKIRYISAGNAHFGEICTLVTTWPVAVLEWSLVRPYAPFVLLERRGESLFLPVIQCIDLSCMFCQPLLIVGDSILSISGPVFESPFESSSFKFDFIADRAFRLDELTGSVTIKSGSTLDYETIAQYDVTIIAEDHGSPPKQVNSIGRTSLRMVGRNIVSDGRWCLVCHSVMEFLSKTHLPAVCEQLSVARSKWLFAMCSLRSYSVG